MRAVDFNCNWLLSAVLVLATGLSASAQDALAEATRFGYKGADLESLTNRQYVVTTPGVTNWVPERVMSVAEHYEFTDAERALIAKVGASMPAVTHKQIPAGFTKETEEPWFAWWVKPVSSFGLTGKTGFLAHFNEDAGVWEAGESYFSSYWATKAEAEAALAKLRRELAADCGVKRFHEIADGWIAEYVRLFVMGVVGRKSDGTWSCMLDLRDKCEYGCGAWEPVAEQQDRLDHYRYLKALKSWQAEVAKLIAQNHELVTKRSEELALTPLTPLAGEVVGNANDGRQVCALVGALEVTTNAVAAKAAFEANWNERQQSLERSLGVKAAGEMTAEEIPEIGTVRSQIFTGELFEARLEAFLPAECTEEQPSQWRIMYIERLQPSIVMPPRPQLKR